MRWEPHEDGEQRTDTVDSDFNWMALATVLRLDRVEQGEEAGRPTKAFCSESGKGMEQSSISTGDEK